MPGVYSKMLDPQNHKGNIAEKVVFIMRKYKPYYKNFRKCTKKQISFEAQAKIDEFKMELMCLGLPKEVVNGLHSRMML